MVQKLVAAVRQYGTVAVAGQRKEEPRPVPGACRSCRDAVELRDGSKGSGMVASREHLGLCSL